MSRSGKEQSWVELEADWLFGQIRVQATCGGVRMGDTFIPAAVHVLYRHHTRLKALQDLVYIQCSVTKKYVGTLDKGTTEQGAPFALIIDPNRERLLRADKSPFSQTERYSDEEIVTAERTDERSVILKLNRVVGSYLMEVRLKKNPNTGLDQWGKCERVNPERKF
jgi:hypothetical protein